MRKPIGIRIVLITAFLTGVFALLFCFASAESKETLAERVLTCESISACIEDNGGVRSLYRVDQSAVKALEKDGYSVAYGAVIGLSSFDGESYCSTARALQVKGNAKCGYTAASANTASVVVYATGMPSYVAGKHLDETKSSFSFIATFRDAVAEKYAAELVYAAFVAVTDKNGNEIVIYDCAEESDWETADPKGGKVTFCALADFLLNHAPVTVKNYAYHQNETLRRALTVCGKKIRDPEPPVLLTPIEGEVVLSKADPINYVVAARKAYVTEEYADYTTSIISNYKTNRLSLNDIPLPLRLSWQSNEEGALYEVFIATDEAFTENLSVQTSLAKSAAVYNLLTDTTYYVKLKTTTKEGDVYETPAMTFRTANTVRWIYADGVRNVRDIGGWNGLNQGLIYRGSELNLVSNHDLQITEAGRRVLAIDLGIKTDLDFRAADNNGEYGTTSPIGEGVTWKNYAISNFLSAFKQQYVPVMRTFADYDNYPIYMHCWGGADRTGTVALMLEGVCGVKEEDLAIDLELTSFSQFGYRYRYDNTTFLYASTLARVKTFYGATLQEKFETCFKEVYGLSEAEISNIQAINTQNGAVYDFAEGENGDIHIGDSVGYSFAFRFVMRNSESVTAVTVDGISLPFVFDAQTGGLTVDASALANGFVAGVAHITFDDGSSLRFYIESDHAKKIVADAEAKDFAALLPGVESNTLMIAPNTTCEIPKEGTLALYHAQYETLTFDLMAGATFTVYDNQGNLLSQETLTENKTVTHLLGKERIVIQTGSRWGMLGEFAICRLPRYYD